VIFGPVALLVAGLPDIPTGLLQLIRSRADRVRRGARLQCSSPSAGCSCCNADLRGRRYTTVRRQRGAPTSASGVALAGVAVRRGRVMGERRTAVRVLLLTSFRKAIGCR